MGRKPDEITYSSELVPVNNASANGIHHESCLPPAIMPLFVATAAKPAKYEAYDMMTYLQHAASHTYHHTSSIRVRGNPIP